MLHSSRILFLLILMLLLQSKLSTSKDPKLQVLDGAGLTKGGEIFRNQIGETDAYQILRRAMKFTRRILRANSSHMRMITLVVSSLPMDEVSSTTNIDNMSVIEISTQHLGSFRDGNVTREFEGLVYQQMTSSFLNGAEYAPPGLVDAIAKFLRLEAGFGPSDQWDSRQFKSNATSPWDIREYTVYTGAHFVQYLQHYVCPGFVALLNAKMAYGWSGNYTSQILGQDVDQLWKNWLSAPHPSTSDFYFPAPAFSSASRASFSSMMLLVGIFVI